MSHDRSHVPGGRSGGGRAHLTRQLLLELAAPGGGGAGPVPPSLPSACGPAEAGGWGDSRKQSLEGLTSAYYIYFFILFSWEESRPTILA